MLTCGEDGTIKYIPEHDPREIFEFDPDTQTMKAKIGSFMTSVSTFKE